MPLCVMLSICLSLAGAVSFPFYAGCFAPIVELSSLFFTDRGHARQPDILVLCACAILRWQLGTRWRYG